MSEARPPSSFGVTRSRLLLTKSALSLSLRHLIRKTSLHHFSVFLFFFFLFIYFFFLRRRKKKPLLECGAVAQDRYGVTLLAPWYMHAP